MKLHYSSSILWTALGVVALATTSLHAAPALVSNGDFELNSGVGQIGSVISLTDWTNVTSPAISGPGFNFVGDSNADSSGFPSIYSGFAGNILLWGPNTGVNNGFFGSPSGGSFLVSSIDYANSSLLQTISGLQIGNQYTVSFDWGAAQFTDASGAFTAGWQVSLGSESATTTLADVNSHGFYPWENFSYTFTATSTEEILSLTAVGTAAGTGGVALLDGINLTDIGSSIPEPSTYALMGVGLLGMALLRRRVNAPAV